MRAPLTPRFVDLVLTNGCNLRCRYCYHFGSAGDVPADLPQADWLQFFDELARAAVMEVNVTGGEPLHRPDWAELLTGLDDRRLPFVLYSNGTLVGPAEAGMLAALKRCRAVQVSLDGGRSETHDACRGRGSFRKALAGIEALRAAGLNVRVRVTLHRHNVDELEETARFLLEEVGLPSFSVNAAYDMGLCSRNRDFIQLSVDDQSRAMQTLLLLLRRYPGRISGQGGPLAHARHWSSMERARREQAPPRSNGGCLTACGGVFNRLAVRADGAVVPCNQLSHIVLGQVNRDDLATLWQTHPELVRLRERRAIPLTRFEHCRSCDYLEYCGGGCPAMVSLWKGNLEEPSPDDCLRRFLEMGGRLPDENLVNA